MSDVKRYEIDVYYNGLQTEEDDDGEWVKYEDVEEHIAELEATIAETVEKAAFVDEMCKALGVTFEALVNDDSVKAGIKEKDDE